MDKFTRQLSLVALLEQSPRPLTFERIRGDLKGDAYPQPDPESARRSFERDKKDLLGMGVPLETREVPDDPSNSAYSIDRRRSKVGDPGFEPAELAALRFAATAVALRSEGSVELSDATDGLRKYGGLGSATTVPTQAEVSLDANVAAIFTAVLDRRVVAFTHSERTRRVLPQQLYHLKGNWYLRGHDLDAGTTRNYRLDRIDGTVLPVGDPGESAAPPPVDPELGTLRFRPWEFGEGESQQVEIRLDAPAAAVALADDPALEVTRRDDDRAAVVVLDVRNTEGLWPWLASFLDRAEILAPDPIREAWIAHLHGLAEGSGSAPTPASDLGGGR